MNIRKSPAYRAAWQRLALNKTPCLEGKLPHPVNLAPTPWHPGPLHLITGGAYGMHVPWITYPHYELPEDFSNPD